jgi:hypothetical protein
VAAVGAAQAREAAGQHAAVQEAAEFVLDEGRVAKAAVLLGALEQGREVGADRLVQRGLVGAPSLVGLWQRGGRGARVALEHLGVEAARIDGAAEAAGRDTRHAAVAVAPVVPADVVLRLDVARILKRDCRTTGCGSTRCRR